MIASSPAGLSSERSPLDRERIPFLVLSSHERDLEDHGVDAERVVHEPAHVQVHRRATEAIG